MSSMLDPLMCFGGVVLVVVSVTPIALGTSLPLHLHISLYAFLLLCTHSCEQNT